MDLGSLANLSLREIASTLNTKQQEVLLASISVAASFIQQLQEQEQLQQRQQQQQQQLNDNNNLESQDFSLNNNSPLSLSNTSIQQQQQQQHEQQQQTINQTTRLLLEEQLLRRNSTTNTTSTPHHHAFNSTAAAAAHNNNNNNHVYGHQDVYGHQVEEDDFDEEEEEEELDELQDRSHVNDQSSDISFDDYSCGDQSLGDHSSTADRQTLLTIREFAEELKHRRKSIRLSQKGAAQSLRAFTSGEQPCTDAIIYHFENLQLEPDRAMTLIPLLRHWLEWAEKHRLNGKQLPMLSAVTKVPRERKRKVVLFNEKAKQNLEDAFLKNNHPDRYQLDVISQELNIPTRSIRKWFTNRRQRKRFAEKFSPVS